MPVFIPDQAPDRIVLASGNPGKIREFSAILGNQTVIPQHQFHVPEVEETGSTFVENAIIKARHAAKICNLPTIADDSGLVVDALNGAPGVISARYAGSGATDQRNLDKLLQAMQDVPKAQRSARFICVIVFFRHASDACPIIAQGIWEGSILMAAAGENGFGYDSIFAVPGKNCSSAELSPETKNIISHRAQALYHLKSQLQLIP